MRVVTHLFSTARRDIVVIAALGVAGGLAGAALVAVVNRALHDHTGRPVLLALFAATSLVKIGASVLSNRRLVQLMQDTILNLSNDLCRRIARAPLREIERIGSARILTILTDDVSVLATAILAIPASTVNVALLAACCAYLAWISWLACAVAVVVAAIGAAAYRVLMGRAYRAINEARKERDVMFAHLRALTEGIKELKGSRRRREAFFKEDLGSSVQKVRDYNIIATNQYNIADASSQFSLHLLIGLLLFLLPLFGRLSLETLTAYVFTALYMMAPVWAIIGAIPAFNRGRAALERIDGLGASLALAPESGLDAHPLASKAPAIEFSGVEFRYEQNGDGDGFKLGPIDFRLEPGELVFVVGGNGSGKSTLVKVLTGLYAPDAGEIRLNGKPVLDGEREAYSECFSAVYSDFFLFERLLGIDPDYLAANAQSCLALLQLTRKVKLNGDRFSTVALSQGQRRRLALMTAFLENRPIYVLDEWAADQDPVYRHVFYRTLLPELKAAGKTVVVVTHDDRYFNLGDRIIKLDYGQIAS
jgi:putative ATP-binding cassette transporter